MSQYPTEEEEFEMLYGQEMDMLNELEDEEMERSVIKATQLKTASDNASQILSLQASNAAGGVNAGTTTAASGAALATTTSQGNQSVGRLKSFFQQSPALSQISFDDSQPPSTSGVVGANVNRRLFDSPYPSGQNVKSRIESTPVHPRQQQHANILEPLAEQSELMSFDATIGGVGGENIINTRKRRLDDLFGDIHDIEDDNDLDDGLYSYLANINRKKIRSKDEIDLDNIEKIKRKRKELMAEINPLKNTHLDRLERLHKFKSQNLSYSVPRYSFATIKSNGERIYIRNHSREFENNQIDEVNLRNKSGSLGLFGSQRQQIWDRANELLNQRLNKQQNPITTTEEVIEEIPPTTIETNLWVEKYRPKKYLDLLSDETTNRSLLCWLKMWDKMVFNKEFKIEASGYGAADSSSGPENSFNKRTGKFEPFGRFRNKQQLQQRTSLKTNVDDLGRPLQKVALLCGPPGLGKTTLAHTIAYHAGYVVREINASDDRSVDAFRLALESGTQMQSVLVNDNRPNCIVLDEIDGAPTQTIEYLIRFINGGGASAGGGGSGSTASGKNPKKGKNKSSILKRPIICICNDMYVPALRNLRQIAFVVNFPPMESTRLAERLLEIARKEKVTTDMTTMLTLAEKTGNDVRSCLSMLQFFNSIKKPITLIDVLKSNIGEKDCQKGLFSVWRSIFQIQRPKKTLTEGNLADLQVVSMTDMSPKTRMSNILNTIHMSGDYERLMNGVYENYLTQKMPDPNMNGVGVAMNWFCFSDRIQSYIHKNQNYSVYPYLQFGFVIWHFLFASMTWPKVNFPHKAIEYSQKSTLQKSVLDSLKKGFTARTYGVGEGATIILDTIPFLKIVLSPSLRSVSLQLLTPKERSDLRHCVEVMADLGLVFIQTKSVDGTYQYQMEPDIDLLGKYNVTTSSSHPSLTYWGKQIIAREVELEQMRRAAPKTNKQVPAIMANTSGDLSKSQPKNQKQPQQNKTALPNHLQTIQSKIADVNINSKFKETVTKDFFGRVSSKQIMISVQEGGSDDIVKSPIWYRYKEGYNNAVRKDITIQNIL